MKVSADKILEIANKYVGTKEYPPNSNKVIFNTKYYGREVSGSSYPWCAVFVWYVFNEAGASELFCGGSKVAYTPTIYNYYKKIDKVYQIPKPGDLAMFKFPGSNRINHIGIVEKVLSSTKVRTIEGNTSVGNDSNGGAVMHRDRSKGYIVGYCRPDYSGSSSNKTSNKSNSDYNQSTFIADVQSILKVDVSGVGNEKTLNATITISKNKNNRHRLVTPIQKYLKSLSLYVGDIDGIAGPLFDNAVRSYQSSFLKKPDGEITSKKTTWKKLLGLI